MKFKGKNFQPWSSFELDINKLTVLVGPSNKGKSALFRALRGVFRNDLPAEYVRNNQDKSLEVEVEVPFGDGTRRVKASRSKKGSTSYAVEDIHPDGTQDGKAFTSLGGKVPEEVQKLNFGEIKIGDYTLDPIFAEQNKAQFLIDADRWKATELNAILGAFASTEKLDAGKKEANTRITQKNGEAKTLGAEIREAEERKAKLAEISVKAEEVQGKVHTLEVEIRKLETVGAWVLEAIARRQRLAPLQKLLTEITIPDVSAVELLYKQTIYLTQAADAGNYSKWLRKVESVLVDVGDKWSEVVRIYKQQKSLVETMELLNKKENSSSQLIAKNLSTVITSLETAIEEAVSLQSSIKYIAAVQVYQQRITAKEAELIETENALSDARAEVEEINRLVAEAKAKEAQPGLCPRCGRPLEHVCE